MFCWSAGMIQRSFSGLSWMFLYCCSLHAALLCWEPFSQEGLAKEPACLPPTAVSWSLWQSALLTRAQSGSAALCKISLFSFGICMRPAHKCFWSWKSRVWLRSSCHKLKTGRGGEKGRTINEKHIREMLLLWRWQSLFFSLLVFWQFLYVWEFALWLSKISAFQVNSR